jgi:hypothetical protein
VHLKQYALHRHRLRYKLVGYGCVLHRHHHYILQKLNLLLSQLALVHQHIRIIYYLQLDFDILLHILLFRLLPEEYYLLVLPKLQVYK